jgi:hypothetical protein
MSLVTNASLGMLSETALRLRSWYSEIPIKASKASSLADNEFLGG